MEFCGDVIWISDARIAGKNIVIFSIAIVQGEAECGTVCDGITANWRCREFSSVSSKGVIEEESGEKKSKIFERFHEI